MFPLSWPGRNLYHLASEIFEEHVTCPYLTRYMLSHITWHFPSFSWSTFNCQFKLKNRCIHIQITFKEKTCWCPITNLWEWKYILIWTLKEYVINNVSFCIPHLLVLFAGGKNVKLWSWSNPGFERKIKSIFCSSSDMV